mgnify:CR=1 FL=1
MLFRSTPALLQLIWLASPALPVGGFSYSEGLEAAIDHGLVHDEPSCTRWLTDQLMLTQARGDMAAIAQAVPAWQGLDTVRLRQLNDWVLATRESSEMRLQAQQMGRSLLDWLRNLQRASPEALQCLTALPPTYPLAYALARHDITIVLSEDKPLGAEFFKDYPFKVDTVKSDLEFLNYARKKKADLVVLDRLDNVAEFVTLLGGFCKVVTFEDLGDGAEVADMHIADMYENPKVAADKQLVGMENAVLAPSFESVNRAIEFRENVEEVLVLFGGTDPSNLAVKALQSLEQIDFDGRVTVVRGLGADLIDPKAFNLRLKVLSNVKNMPAVMERADIALSSAGRTITELASLGIPTICMAQNEKELTHTHVTTSNGVLMIGLGRLVSVETLSAHVNELMTNSELRFKLHERGLAATAGRSNDRIVRRILKQIGF